MGLLDRLVSPGGRAEKVIEGRHLRGNHVGASESTPKPDLLPLSEGQERERLSSGCNILVSLTGSDLDREVVTLACNAAKQKHAVAFAVYGIEVPRTLAVDAEMPDETRVANEALERAASVADQLNVHIEPEIVQSRNFGQSLVEEAEAHHCVLLIIGLPYNLGRNGGFDLDETVDYTLKNAPCRVWVVRGQPPRKVERPSEQAEHQEKALV